MTSKRRFLAALDGGKPDRLPVTTHHVQEYFLRRHMGSASPQEFFDRFGLDPILWIDAHRPDASRGRRLDPGHSPNRPAEAARIVSDEWRIESEAIPNPDYKTIRYTILTPGGNLTTVIQSSDFTSWIAERLIKEKKDIELIARHAPAPLCDVDDVNRLADGFGERGLVRGTICYFDIYGQPGCWQDAACLYGIERLILETYDDPDWIRSFLGVLLERKKVFVRSLAGARFDIVEHGGGDASSTVISPGIFERFVAPYDAELIRLAHEAGQRVVYHTCGGMMPILELVAAMGPDAMETFTPPALGGDVDLEEARRRLGDRICFIGGFDQFHFFLDCRPGDTRREVRRCFEAAGRDGAYILSPSDHFFDADPALIAAYAEEARSCVY